jgi:hypothetical protein
MNIRFQFDSAQMAFAGLAALVTLWSAFAYLTLHIYVELCWRGVWRLIAHVSLLLTLLVFGFSIFFLP